MENVVPLTVPPTLVDTILRDVLLHLHHLERDEIVVPLPVTVVLDEGIDGVLLASVGHEVSRGFRDEEHGAHDDDARKGLEDERELPREVAVDVVGAEGDGGGGDGAAEPTTVVETFDGVSTVPNGVMGCVRCYSPVQRPRQ
jgi:hypothetical protein